MPNVGGKKYPYTKAGMKKKLRPQQRDQQKGEVPCQGKK